MDQDNNPPRIQPPSSKNIKKASDTERGSFGKFIKRNPWLILVAAFVILMGLGVWYVVSKVRRVIKRYEVMARQQDTLVKEMDTAYREAYDPAIKTAKLIIHGGTAAFRLSGATNQLFSADARLYRTRYEVKSYNEYSDHVVDFSMKNDRGRNPFWGKNGQTDSVNFKLNTAPIWDIKIETGATDLNFDLSKFKVHDIALKGGAAQMVLKMGEPLEYSTITIETGASNVTINIPKDAACSIESSSGLSSTDFPGIKKEDGHYETDNFASAKNKYHIYIRGGVSDYKVHQY